MVITRSHQKKLDAIQNEKLSTISPSAANEVMTEEIEQIGKTEQPRTEDPVVANDIIYDDIKHGSKTFSKINQDENKSSNVKENNTTKTRNKCSTEHTFCHSEKGSRSSSNCSRSRYQKNYEVQAEIYRDTLDKLKPVGIKKIGRIPKKSCNEEDKHKLFQSRICLSVLEEAEPQPLTRAANKLTPVLAPISLPKTSSAPTDLLPPRKKIKLQIPDVIDPMKFICRKPKHVFQRQRHTSMGTPTTTSSERKPFGETGQHPSIFPPIEIKNVIPPNFHATRFPLRGILANSENKGPKRSIRWKDDKDLVDIRYFELDKTERENVVKKLKHPETDKLIKRKLNHENEMTPCIIWRTPYLVDQSDSLVTPGSKSLEKVIQHAKSKNNPQRLHFNEKSDTPEEPDTETYPEVEPVNILLEHEETRVVDLTHMSWPEPKDMEAVENALVKPPMVQQISTSLLSLQNLASLGSNPQHFHFNEKSDSPEEPDIENHPVVEPVIILLEHETTTLLDLTHIPWPEPKDMAEVVMPPMLQQKSPSLPSLQNLVSQGLTGLQQPYFPQNIVHSGCLDMITNLNMSKAPQVMYKGPIQPAPTSEDLWGQNTMSQGPMSRDPMSEAPMCQDLIRRGSMNKGPMNPNICFRVPFYQPKMYGQPDNEPNNMGKNGGQIGRRKSRKGNKGWNKNAPNGCMGWRNNGGYKGGRNSKNVRNFGYSGDVYGSSYIYPNWRKEFPIS